jgi:hypothetical protein
MLSTPERYCGESDKDLHQKRFLEAFEVSCSIQKAAIPAVVPSVQLALVQ